MTEKDQLKQLLASTNALLEAMRFSIQSPVTGPGGIWKYYSFGTFLVKYDHLVDLAGPLLQDTSMLDRIDTQRIPRPSSLTWPQQKQLFDTAYSNASLLKSLLEGAIGYAADETQKLKDFIQSNLRRAIFEEPQKEAEVQNAVESLLIGRNMAKGTEYDRETGRVKTSGKESIPDFIFRHLNLCLEVKLSKSQDKLRAIVDEINSDIRAYGAVYERQLYVVYDLGVIRDEGEFKHDLENVPGVAVIIVKH